MTTAPRASVVIPTRNAGPGFRETLEAILDQAYPGPFEVIVIDSGSRDGTVDLCCCLPVRLIQIPPASFSHGAARNQALAEAQGVFVALTVQDAVPTSRDWLQALVQPMISDPQVAGVYGRQVPRPDASYLAQQRNRLWYGLQESRAVKMLRSTDEWQSLSFEERRQLTRFDNVTSCLRRSTWQEIPFPPYNYAEDVGWALEALQAGYKLLYEPAARVHHSHDRDLAYDFRRAYIDTRNVACVLDAPPRPMTSIAAQRLLGWLCDQARLYLATLDGTQKAPEIFGQALSQADAHWTRLGADELQGHVLDAPSLDSALREEVWHQERFDTAVVRCLFGPDSPYPAQEREWLLAEIGWLRAGGAEEKAHYRTLFDRAAAHYLMGPDSPRPAEDRAWLAGKLQLWSEDETQARARYRAHFDAECIAYLLGPHSAKTDEAQTWLAAELDRLEQERSRLGLRLGRRLSQRLVQSQPRERDVALAFALLWGEISRDYAREAVNVRFLQTGGNLAHLFDRLWALGALDLLKDAIGRSLRSGLEAALAGKRSLSDQELSFVFYSLWNRLGREYVKGAVADLTPEGAQYSLVKRLCTDAWLAGELTHEIVGRAWLYAAADIAASSLGLAARAALAAEDPRRVLVKTEGARPSDMPTARQEEPTRLWQHLEALLEHPEPGTGFWARLDETLAQAI